MSHISPRIIIGLLLIPIIWTCQSDDFLSVDDANVYDYAFYGVLYSDKLSQEFLVTKVLTGDSVSFYEQLPPGATNAIGTINGQSLILRLPENGYYYDSNYIVDSLIVSPGNEYSLELTIDNEQINGRTRVPSGLNVALSETRISWSGQPEKHFVRLYLSIWDTESERWEMFWDTSLINQTEYDFADDIQRHAKEMRLTSNRFLYRVEIFDDNYYQYEVAQNHSAGLENAYGVLGSAIVFQGQFTYEY